MPSENKKRFHSKAKLFWTLISDCSFRLIDLKKSSNLILRSGIPIQERPGENFYDISPSLACVFHIHYRESMPAALEFISTADQNITFFVCFTDLETLREFQIEAKGFAKTINTKLVPNLGRNFTSLFVWFVEEVREFDYILHWHSKKSTHSSLDVSKPWIESLNSCLLDSAVIKRALGIMERRPEISIMYPDVSHLFRPATLKWGSNFAPLTSVLGDQALLKALETKSYIAFPIGGMFLIRTAEIIQLSNLGITLDAFPPEQGQLDGTFQHGLERLIGRIIEIQDKSQMIYQNSNSCFFEIKKLMR